MTLLFQAASANAQTRSWSYTFDPNQRAQSFQTQPTLPPITFTASYDNTAGTLTISESGGDPSYDGYWQADSFAFYPVGYDSSPSEAPYGVIEWNQGGDFLGPGTSSFGPLRVNGINGSLAGSNTVSGNTITATYSSPLLRGLNWTLVKVGSGEGYQDNSCGCDQRPEHGAYFPGYEPFINLTLPDRASKVGQYVEVALDPPVENLASADAGVAEAVTVRGLPPGLTFYGGPEGSGIAGWPSQPGVYTVKVTAQADVSGGTITATRTFRWTVKTRRHRRHR